MEKDSSKISTKQKEGSSSSRRRLGILASERHKSQQLQAVLSTPDSTAKEIVPLQIHPSPPKLKRKIYSSGNEQEEHSSFMSSSFLFSSERLNLPSFDEIFGSSSTFIPLNLRPRKCSLAESKDLSDLLPHGFSDLDSDDGESTDDQEQSSHDGTCDSSTATSIRLVSAFERPSTRRRG